jgi:hypothetical protein
MNGLQEVAGSIPVGFIKDGTGGEIFFVYYYTL